MATNKWLGTATAVVQLDTYTPANANTGDEYILTLSVHDGSTIVVSFTVAGTETVAAVTAGLHAAWTASGASAYATSADGTTELTLTGITAGVEFNVAPSIVDGSGGAAPTLVKVETTANAGPNDWSSADNWTDGVPNAADDIFIEDSAVSILYGLDQSAAGTMTSLHINRTYTGLIGWNGTAGLIGDYLQLRVSKAFIGEYFQFENPIGSGRIKIDFGTVASDITVYNMSTSTDSPKPAFRMLANEDTDVTGTILRDIRKGSVGIASETGETSAMYKANISYATNSGTDASLVVGAGATFTASTGAITAKGGKTSIFGVVANVTSEKGQLVTSGTGAITTLNVDGGAVTPASTGTITTCNITAGSCDFTASAEPRTVTTLKIDPPGILQIDESIVTLTNQIQPFTTSGRVQYRASAI